MHGRQFVIRRRITSELRESGCLEQRAVSPVIGVVLIVAIAVILSTVIGVFVLGESGADPVPQTNIDGDQQSERYVWSDTHGTHAAAIFHVRLNDIAFHHRGGEGISQDELRVDATVRNTSTGQTTSAAAIGLANATAQRDSNSPRADMSTTVSGWNSQQEATITSGDSSTVSMYLDPSGVTTANGELEAVVDGEAVCATESGIETPSPSGKYTQPMPADSFQAAPAEDDWSAFDDRILQLADQAPANSGPVDCDFGSSRNKWGRLGDGGWERIGVLTESDVIQVVWRPPGSDQSQPLRAYTVE